jgi:hypothetical protein
MSRSKSRGERNTQKQPVSQRSESVAGEITGGGNILSPQTEELISRLVGENSAQLSKKLDRISHMDNVFSITNYPGIMMASQLNLVHQVLTKAGEEINANTAKISEESNKLGDVARFQGNPVELVTVVASCRQHIQNALTWVMMASAATLELSESLPELIDNATAVQARDALKSFELVFNSSLINLPSNSIFGIYLKPESEQVSRAKALISEAYQRLEEIEKSNLEEAEDWGLVEQAAFERMNESHPQRANAKDVLARFRKQQESNLGV